MNTDQNFTDKEILDDIVSSQKHITDIYNTFSNECVNQQLQSDMLKILGEEHNMQFTAFGEMQLPDGQYAMLFEMYDATGASALSDVVLFDCANGEIMTTVF